MNPKLFHCLAVLLLAASLRAADKSGVSSSAISLPSGPGSIGGLGEAFQPSPNTGTGGYSVKINVPPGTAGAAPSLSISYEGGDGNGPLGIGWSITSAYIQRQTDKGTPRYVDGSNSIDDDLDGEIDEANEVDVFIDQSREELVPVPNGVWVDYFTEHESAFVRYRKVDDYWEGTQPDGTRLIFGESVAARVVDPSSPTHTFRWLLEKTIDTHGNTIVYKYTTFPDEQNSGQVYLSEIAYGPGGPPWDNLHTINLRYENRLDWFTDCSSGFAIRTGKRLKEIVVATQCTDLSNHKKGDYNNDGTPDFLNRKYILEYVTGVFGSIFAKVRMIGTDETSEYPATSFNYTVPSESLSLSLREHVIGSVNEPPSAFDNEFVDLLDLNGDSLPDLLRTGFGGAAHQAFINGGERDGSIHWMAGVEVNAEADLRAYDLSLADHLTHLSDMNGDGLADLVQVGMDQVYYFRNEPKKLSGQGAWSERIAINSQDFVPPSPFGQPGVRTADLNSDKRIDIIKSIEVGNGYAYQIWYNLSEGTYSERQTVTPETAYSLARPEVFVADFNGDRVSDIIWVRPGYLGVITGLGYGRFTPENRVSFPDSYILASQEVEKAKMQDIDGDGLDDLVIENTSPGVLSFWKNRGNYSLGPRREFTDLPAKVGVNVATRWADMNGNGTTDLVYSDPGADPKMKIVDIGAAMGCVPRPYLLTEVDNGIGGITQIKYKTSVTDMLADGLKPDGSYSYTWPGPLPFPIDVVSKITQLDSLGGRYEQNFTYHGGYYDPFNKQFRGFERAEVMDLGDETAPSLVTQSYFDTGRSDRALKGSVLRTVAMQDDGSVFTDEQHNWTVRELYTGSNGQRVRFPYTTSKTRHVIELGTGPRRTTLTEFVLDSFGNQTEQHEHGFIGEPAEEFKGDERATFTEYAYNTNNWLVRFPTRQRLKDGLNATISLSETYYDDPSFNGSNPGQVTRGDVTLVRAWYDLNTTSGYINQQRTTYDSFGNAIAQLDPLASGATEDTGHWKQWKYNSSFQNLIVQERLFVGGGKAPLEVNATYDDGLGIMLTMSDYNGAIFRNNYNPLGQIVSSVGHLDDSALPAINYRYDLSSSVGQTGLINVVETRVLQKQASSRGDDSDYLITRQFIDGLGRVRMVKSGVFGDGSSTSFSVNGACIYNGRSRVSRLLQPYFSNSADFEDIRGPGWSGLFHREGKLVSLNLKNADQTTTIYDAIGRDRMVLHSSGTKVSTTYRPNESARYDENDNDPQSPHYNTPTSSFCDGLGRLIQVVERLRRADGVHEWRSSYKYRADDQVTEMIDSQGNRRTFEYDNLSRLVSAIDPNRGPMHWMFDDGSNLIKKTDAKGQVTTYQYDGRNRKIAVDYQDTDSTFSYNHSPDVQFVYDEFRDGSPVAGLPFQKGRLAAVIDITGVRSMVYDAIGRTVETRRTIANSAATHETYIMKYEYDHLDRLRRVTYPDSDYLDYNYTPQNSLESIVSRFRGPILRDIQHTPSAQQASMVYGNGVVTSWAYNNKMLPSQLKISLEGDLAHPLSAYLLSYDSAANITEIRDFRSASSRGNIGLNTQRMSYDSLDRLNKAEYYDDDNPGGAPRSLIKFDHDQIGNLVRRELSKDGVDEVWDLHYGAQTGPFNRDALTLDQPGPNAVTSIHTSDSARNIEYDRNGNVIAAAGWKYTWDFEDHLIQAENDQFIIEHLYDSNGARVSKRVRSKNAEMKDDITLYINQYYEVRPAGESLKYVIAQGKRIAQFRDLISSTNTVQLVNLSKGWNLVGLTVTPTNAVAPFSGYDVFRALPSGGYARLAVGEALAAGAILWIHASSNATIPLRGLYDGPRDVFAVHSGFVHSGLIPLHPTRDLPADATVWVYDQGEREWRIERPSDPRLSTLAGGRVQNGAAAFVRLSNAFATLPDSRPKVLYFHSDPIGSGAMTTDENGRLISETYYYPFGEVRGKSGQNALGSFESAYSFAGKEEDEHTKLAYFEARYLGLSVGRFMSVEPLCYDFKLQLANPQRANGYSFAVNNPYKQGDPDGNVTSLLAGYRLWQSYKSLTTAKKAVASEVELDIMNRVNRAAFDAVEKLMQTEEYQNGNKTKANAWDELDGYVAGLEQMYEATKGQMISDAQAYKNAKSGVQKALLNFGMALAMDAIAIATGGGALAISIPVAMGIGAANGAINSVGSVLIEKSNGILVSKTSIGLRVAWSIASNAAGGALPGMSNLGTDNMVGSADQLADRLRSAIASEQAGDIANRRVLPKVRTGWSRFKAFFKKAQVEPENDGSSLANFVRPADTE